MGKCFSINSASQNEVMLYCLVGEALTMVQHLEDCLSHSIIIKTNPRNTPKMRADKILEGYRAYTLGKAISVAKDKALFSASIQQELKDFLKQRNWLVHRSIAHHRNDLLSEIAGKNLVQRIRSITRSAKTLLHILEEDLFDYCTGNGANMANVRYAANKNGVREQQILSRLKLF